jgi:hypothetical protein
MKWEFGYTSQGILHVWTPPLGQPALGTAQCTIVSCCQMSRCHKALSRVSCTLQWCWHAGHSMALPQTCSTQTWSSSGKPSCSLNQTLQDPPLVAKPHGTFQRAVPACSRVRPSKPAHRVATLCENPTFRIRHAQCGEGILPTRSFEEPKIDPSLKGRSQKSMERATGFEPATSTLARLRATNCAKPANACLE